MCTRACQKHTPCLGLLCAGLRGAYKKEVSGLVVGMVALVDLLGPPFA